MALSIFCHTVFCGLQILHPKTGLHEAALTAGLRATMDTTKSERILSYQPVVSKEQAMVHSAAWVAAGGGRERGDAGVQIVPLIRVAVADSLGDAVAEITNLQ